MTIITEIIIGVFSPLTLMVLIYLVKKVLKDFGHCCMKNGCWEKMKTDLVKEVVKELKKEKK